MSGQNWLVRRYVAHIFYKAAKYNKTHPWEKSMLHTYLNTMQQKTTKSMGKACIAHTFTEAAKNVKIFNDIVFLYAFLRSNKK